MHRFAKCYHLSTAARHSNKRRARWMNVNDVPRHVWRKKWTREGRRESNGTTSSREHEDERVEIAVVEMTKMKGEKMRPAN